VSRFEQFHGSHRAITEHGNIPSLNHGSDEEEDFVHKTMPESFAEGMATPFDKDAGDPALGECLEGGAETHSREKEGSFPVSIGEKF
jgi:hypothetical protein